MTNYQHLCSVIYDYRTFGPLRYSDTLYAYYSLGNRSYMYIMYLLTHGKYRVRCTLDVQLESGVLHSRYL